MRPRQKLAQMRHGHTGHPAFPAQWFIQLLRAHPGDRAVLPPSPARLRSDPASRCQVTRLGSVYSNGWKKSTSRTNASSPRPPSRGPYAAASRCGTKSDTLPAITVSDGPTAENRLHTEVSTTIRTATRNRHNPRFHPPAGYSRTRIRDTRSKNASSAAVRSAGAGGATRDRRSSIARSRAISTSSPVRRASRCASCSTLVERMFMDHRQSFESTGNIPAFGAEIAPIPFPEETGPQVSETLSHPPQRECLAVV